MYLCVELMYIENSKYLFLVIFYFIVKLLLIILYINVFCVFFYYLIVFFDFDGDVCVLKGKVYVLLFLLSGFD